MGNRRVKIGVPLTILFVQAVLPCTGFGASAQLSREPANLLPWQVIAENVREGACFCENTDNSTLTGICDANRGLRPGRNYAYQTNQAITIKLPAGIVTSRSLQKIDAKVAKWVGSSWQDISKVSACTESNDIRISPEIEEEGFLRLRLVLGAHDGPQFGFETFAIVSDDWKADILAFCRQFKEEIESNRDPKLIFSSIAISHFDHAMEMVSKASFLSGKILKALSVAVESKEILDAGKCPELVAGLNKIRLRRFEGADIAEFVVFVPGNYDNSRKWPLYLYPDPRRFNAGKNYSRHSGFIDLWWHFPSPLDFEWKDCRYLLNILKSKLNLNEDRFYLYGHCANGISAMALALNYPDRWAECGISLGNSYLHMGVNAWNLPLIFVGGEQQEVSYAGYYEFALKCFQYYGLRHFKYGRKKEIVQTRGAPLPDTVREKNPQRVVYRIESLKNPNAYWVKILGRENENFVGSLDASVDGQTILVKANNINAYSLDLVQAPVDSNSPIEIIENEERLDVAKGKVFTRKPEAYKHADYVKNQHIHGPVWDAFTDPYVVVWGTAGQDKHLCEISSNIAKSIADGGACFADVNMPDGLVNSHNLILMGTAESNLWLPKICTDLPVQIKEGKIVANGKRYNGRDMGFILIYPNPLNPKKYAVVFSATSSRAMAKASEAYSQMKSLQPADAGIFEVAERGDIKWHIIEKFNTVWGWHKQWDQVLGVVNHKHPKWQWAQWVAKTIREQLEVDVVFCENPFKLSDTVPTGSFTYRDIFNTFKNYWIVKIQLKGKDLRKLLMAPFSGISQTKGDIPIIDGVSFRQLQENSEETILGINDIENDQQYKVALPYQFVNGRKLGMLLKDYKILGEYYVVPLLKEFLCQNKNLDIDAQLDSLVINMF